MIHSMTAFGSGRGDTEQGSLTLELRSVNSRFLDLHFRLPDELRGLEAPLRDRLTQSLARGKIEIRANLQRRINTHPDALHLPALEQAAELFKRVQHAFPDVVPPRFTELLNWPGVQANAESEDAWRDPALAALNDALSQLSAARAREGERLAQMIQQRAEQVRQIVADVETHLPALLSDYRERLSKKLHDAMEQAFPGGFQSISGAELSERLAQESTLFGLRIDVAEELSRLQSHLTELTGLLSGKGKGKHGATGKRLDFLFQEMNREANTLGSKAGSVEVTRAAMDLKLLIEQMREQAQNIE
ncbi:MAG: YicC family protein [Pigmentiphaga sp.]|nr:YicC family protein [Pigmentiphaga sp.]